MPQALALSGKTIVIIDQEALIALDVETIVTDHGATAVIVARAADVNAVITDLVQSTSMLVIDHASARTAFSSLAELFALGVPTILTTTGSDLVFETGLPPHARIVEKPFSDKDMVAALQTLI